MRIDFLHSLPTGLPQAARAYSEAGWPIIPLEGKRPVHPGWQNVTVPVDTSSWSFNSNIGLVCGINSIVVVDVDGDVGVESIKELQRKHGKLPQTLLARTGGGGYHLLLRWPGQPLPRNSTSKLGPKVDTRGVGGQIVLAPSLHASGQLYQWVRICEIALAPTWLVEALGTKPASVQGLAAVPPRSSDRIVYRAIAWVSKLPPSVSGCAGYSALFRACVAVARGFELNDSECLAALRAGFNSRCTSKTGGHYPWDEKELLYAIGRARRLGSMPFGTLRNQENRNAA